MTDKPTQNDNPTHLDENEHFFRLAYGDGFGWRLLSVILLVDLDFNYQLNWSTFQEGEENEKIKKGTLPNLLREKIEILLKTDLGLLEESYFIHEGASGTSSYYLAVNQYGDISTSMIGWDFYTSHARTELEKLIFETVDQFSKWFTKETGYTIIEETDLN